MAAMSDPKANAAEVARRLGMTTTTLYAYVNGDGWPKAAGSAVLSGHGHARQAHCGRLTAARVPVMSDTAYPGLPSEPGAAELGAFTPEEAELTLARQRTRQPGPRLALLVLVKAFQRLGYTVRLADVPLALVAHVARFPAWLTPHPSWPVTTTAATAFALWPGARLHRRGQLRSRGARHGGAGVPQGGAHPTVRTSGALSQDTARPIVFKLVMAAAEASVG